MSAHDVYGGACPLCSGRMFQRFSSDAEGEAFEGCPLCGFAYGSDGHGMMKPAKVWQAIFQGWHVLFVEQIRERLPREDTAAQQYEFQETVFSYSGEPVESLERSRFSFPGRGQVVEMLGRLYDAGELELVAHHVLDKDMEIMAVDHERLLTTSYTLLRRGEKFLPPDAEPLYATTCFALDKCLARPSRRYGFSPGITELAVDLPMAETICEAAVRDGIETGDDARSRIFDGRSRRWHLDTGISRIFTNRRAGGAN